MDWRNKRRNSVLLLPRGTFAFHLRGIHMDRPVCQDTTTHTCITHEPHTPPFTVQTPPALGSGCCGASVLQAARRGLAAGLTAGFRPQLFLKFLDYFFQVFSSFPFMHQVSPELLPVSLCVLKLNLEVLNLGKSKLETQELFEYFSAIVMLLSPCLC